MLNERQIEAVKSKEGPVVIIAGPGTGKTKTLVERVVDILIYGNTKPERILLTTFTNKAALELQTRINERLEEIDVEIDINGMYLGTMHSIWIRLIEENIKYSNFFDNFEIMTDHEQHFFIYSKLKEYKKIEGFSEFFKEAATIGAWQEASYIKNKINELNEKLIGIKEIRTSDKNINFFKEVYKLYENQLYEANKIDYSYIQIEFLNMLLNNNNLLEHLNDKIDFLMIDEYQDSNKIQEKILLLLSKNKKNICVVGDEDQSIYRFRGASAENILNFSKYFEECKTIILNQNYRSVNDIVEFNNKWINLIDWKGHRFQKDIVSMRTENLMSTNVLNIGGNSNFENIRNTVNFIKQLKMHKKITNYNQVAILFTTFKDSSSKKLEEALKKEGIEVFSPRTKVFFEMEEIKISLGLLLACYSKKIIHKDNYLESCLDEVRKLIKKDGSFLEYIKAKIENIDLYEYDSLNNLFYEFFQFDYYREVFDENREKNIEDSTQNNLNETEKAIISRRRYNLSVLTKIFRSFQENISYKKINSENNYQIIKYFFEKYIFILQKSNLDSYFSDDSYPDNCIPFLTIHKSKGLEFPVVIVRSLYTNPRSDNQENTSLERLINSGSKLSEIDKGNFDFYRKFYVAFTRAKNLLVLSSSFNNLSDKFKRIFYSVPGMNSLNFNMDEMILDEASTKEEKKIFSYTTDISLYRYCSMKYFLVRETELQTFQKIGLNIGSIVHRAIEHINKRVQLDENQVFSDGYIEKLVKKIYSLSKMEIDENFDRVVELILKYIEEERDNFKYIFQVENSEYRIEKDFILYGKIDLLLKKGNTLEIIDFKTGKHNEKEDIYKDIYRKQLSLYRLLLQNKYKDFNIKSFLYYLEENVKKEIIIADEELQEDFLDVTDISTNIINKNFHKKNESDKNCKECEFKYYCYRENGEN